MDLEEITPNSQNYSNQIKEDYVFKIVILGDCAVGKSNLLSRYIKNEFNKCSMSTIGVELSTKIFKIDDKIIKVTFWDTDGQERFASLVTSYYKGAKGALLVYDITRLSTFASVEKWMSELRQLNSNNIVISMVGNKKDLNLLRTISYSQAESKAKKLGVNYYETSALDSSNVKKAFEEIIKEIYFRTKKGLFKNENKINTFALNKINNNIKKEEDNNMCSCN